MPSADRAVVKEMLTLHGLIDLIIPRGGEGLIRAVREGSQIPVIAHDKGLCHTYVDESADLAMAAEIAYNAKVERPGVCNAMETLLVHERRRRGVPSRLRGPPAGGRGGGARLPADPRVGPGGAGRRRGGLGYGVSGAHPFHPGGGFLRGSRGPHRPPRLRAWRRPS